MVRIAIVGGGPGRLLTARLIEEKYRDFCQITIFEASARIGAKIVTEHFDAAPVRYEAGVAELHSYADLGLDPVTQRAVLATLRRLSAGRTTIFATHREAAIAGADLLFLMQDGTVVELQTARQC
jgi:protoporphyrinogen oxidase